MKKGLIVVLVLLLIAFGICIGLQLNNDEKLPDYSSIRPEALDRLDEAVTQTPDVSETAGPEATQSAPRDYLEACKLKNSDTVAWVYIKDTSIDYPVTFTDNNDFYLHHDFYKENKKAGNPFLDYRCEGDFRGFNSIIYGHHMGNGTMFADLVRFKNRDFFDEHPTGTITLSDGIYKLNIIAVVVLPSDGFVYDTVFLSSKDREQFCEKLKESAMFYRTPDKDVTKTGVITLSTCSYEYEEARTVVVGYIDREI